MTSVSVTERDAYMHAKTSCLCLEIDSCLFALLLVQSRVVRELKELKLTVEWTLITFPTLIDTWSFLANAKANAPYRWLWQAQASIC